MTDAQILAIQSYILACVKYETAHHCEKGRALIEMVEAQTRMRDALLTPAAIKEIFNEPRS